MRLQQKPIYDKQRFKSSLVSRRTGKAIAVYSKYGVFGTNRHLIPDIKSTEYQSKEYIDLPLINSVGMSVVMPMELGNICIIGNGDNESLRKKLSLYIQDKFGSVGKPIKLLNLGQFLRLSYRERNNHAICYIVNIDGDDISTLAFQTISSSFNNFFISKPNDLQSLCSLRAKIYSGNRASEIIRLVSNRKNFELRKYLLSNLTTGQFLAISGDREMIVNFSNINSII